MELINLYNNMFTLVNHFVMSPIILANYYTMSSIILANYFKMLSITCPIAIFATTLIVFFVILPVFIIFTLFTPIAFNKHKNLLLKLLGLIIV